MSSATTTAIEYANTLLVGGGKGGVGKSTCTLALHYVCSRAGQNIHLVEADTSNPDVGKALEHTDASANMSTLDLDREDGWLDLLNLRVAHPDRTIIINTGSRSNQAFEQFGPLLEAGLKELGAPLTTFWPIDGNRDCVELLIQYRQTVSSGRCIVLRNAHLSRSFELYDNSKIRQEIEASGGRSLTLPALSARVAQTLNANRLSLSAAETSTALQFGHKIALRTWLQSVSTTLAEVAA